MGGEYTPQITKKKEEKDTQVYILLYFDPVYRTKMNKGNIKDEIIALVQESCLEGSISRTIADIYISALLGLLI